MVSENSMAKVVDGSWDVCFTREKSNGIYGLPDTTQDYDALTCVLNGFGLKPDEPGVIDIYGARSSYFRSSIQVAWNFRQAFRRHASTVY